MQKFFIQFLNRGLKPRARLYGLLMSALLIFSCRPNNQMTLNLMGSTTVSPIVEKLAHAYKKDHAIRINIQAVGSSMGVMAVQDKLTDIGMTSRALSSDEADNIEQTSIAIDAISIIVHPTNPITNLTKEDIFNIFTGKVKNWKEVGGLDMPIIVVSREAGSGTRSAFEEMMGLIAPDKRSLVELSKPLIAEGTGAIKANVASKKYAVSYVSIGVIDSAIKSVSIDNIEPNEANVRSGAYWLAHPLLLLTNSTETTEQAEDFIAFALSDLGQQIIASQGLVRVD